MFVMLFLGLLDTQTGTLTYTNAGHPVPHILRASGEIEQVHASPDMPLGVRGKTTYRTGIAMLKPGDATFVATDGVIEAMNAEGLYTLDRLNNAGDAKALAQYFTDDAAYTDENGQLTQGRSDIEQLLTDTFAENKGATLDVQVDSVRPLDSNLYEEKGTTTVTSLSGDKQSSSYTAIHVKKDGQWPISRLFEFPAADPTPGQQLSQLAWMVGTWKDKGGSTSVETKADWARGNNFLTRTFKVSQGDDVLLEGWQIIGWDPIENRIRSWIFDSDGGYGQGVWSRDGNRWLVKETRVSADGGESSAEQTLTYVDQDHCTYESANRTLNGDLQPKIDKIEIDRVKTQ
jgi:uncharacterized protein (TIGR02246 family)